MSFERFTRPVIEFLRSLGLDAAFSGRNDIQVSGYKISGNAQTRCGDRFMHHGTLLFGANMTDLPRADRAPAQNPGKEHPVRAGAGGEYIGIPCGAHGGDRVYGQAAGFCRGAVPGRRGVRLYRGGPRCYRPALRGEIRAVELEFRGEPGLFVSKKTAKFDGGLIEVRMDIEGERIARIRIAGDFFRGCGDVRAGGRAHRRAA